MNILETITAKRVAAAHKYSVRELEKMIEDLPLPRSFADAFRNDGISIIAELKKASPSKGLIRADFHPEILAPILENAGAAALSVLTEPEYFLGSLDYLEKVHKIVKLPLLRKDFITQEIQILEARAAGASAVLLIAAVLTAEKFRTLHQFAKSIGLDILCESHSREEIEMLAENGAEIIGVNARNLKDFHVSQDVVLENLSEIPAGIIRIAESGIRNREDIRTLHEAGADGFLIGEALMRESDPGAKLREFLS